MAKKKKKRTRTEKSVGSKALTRVISEPLYTHEVWKVRHGLWTRRTSPKPSVFTRDQPGLATTRAVTKTIRPKTPEKIAKKFEGFQLETRVTSCDLKRERRRRAYFGYLKSPHAGKGTKSPRSDRFTVKC